MDTLNSIIANGCRFFDFEVYYINNTPYVAYSTDNTFKTIQSDNKILLDNVLSGLVSNAFSSMNCPNSTDPLFIQLRIKSTDNGVYKAVAKSVDYALLNKLYQGKITPQTKLQDIMNKVVLIMDKTINYTYTNYTSCDSTEKNCYDLTQFINIESGSEYMKLQRYNSILSQATNPPTIMNDNETTNVNTILLALPDFDNTNVKNPNIQNLVMNYGCQIVPYRYYIKDDELTTYETFFSENKSAILPLSKAVIYFTKMSE